MTINVNGVELYYEKSGSGKPIILLHGNGQDHTIFNGLIEKLSVNYTVYAIDSRDHGKSSKVKKLNYIDKMEDVYQFIKELEIKKPAIFGFSDGGIIGLLLAINHPDVLSELIVGGANTHPSGAKSFLMFLLKLMHFFTRNNKHELMLTQPNITNIELNSIITPTLVVAGKNDFIKEEHTISMAKNIPGSQLKILEGEDHMSYVSDTEKIYTIITEFLGRTKI